jgi:hypothetical protein
VFFNNTLVAAANNDVLVGLDINPTFTNGAFTGVANAALRVGPVSNAYISSSNASRFGFTTDALTFGQNNFNISTNASGAIQRPNNASRMVLGTANLAGLQPAYLFAIDSVQQDRGLIFDRDNSYVSIINGSNTNSTTYSPRLTVFSSGRVAINTLTDAGFTLDVNGTARIQGQTSISSTSIGTPVVAATFANLGTTAGSTVRINFLSGEDGTVGRTRAVIEAFSSINNDGGLNFQTRSAGSLSDNMRLTGTGQLGVGVLLPNASAKVQIESTTQGFLPPRITTTQRNAISSPAAGLVVYDTTLNVMTYYNGTLWILF